MKPTLIRLLSIMTLAVSMSAYALPAKDKAAGNSNCTTASDPKPASANSGSQNSQDQQDPEKARQQLIEQQNQQWLHDLMGVYGG